MDKIKTVVVTNPETIAKLERYIKSQEDFKKYVESKKVNKILEVRLDVDSLETSQEFMNKTFSSFPLEDRIAIFIVKNKEVISKDIQKLYNSLPISIPFDINISDNIEIKTYLEANNKIYNDYLSIENFSGSMYFVEEKDIENVSNKG